MLDLLAPTPVALLRRDRRNSTLTVGIMPNNCAAEPQLARPRLRPLDIVSSKQMLMRLTRAQHIRRLAMNGIVASKQLCFAHAQRDAEHVLDEAHDERRPHDVPPDDEERAVELQVDLFPVALDGAAEVGDGEGGAAFDGREEADAHAAHEAGDAVRVEDAERVVDFAEVGNFFAHDVHG